MTSAAINPDLFLDNTTDAKESLYKYFAPRMYGICLRFAGNKMEADDILHEGFIKIFTKIKDFRSEGSLEGWIRRTMVNTAINYYRRNLRYSKMGEVDNLEMASDNYNIIYDKISRDELMEIIQELPVGYRTVFNLYVIEGYAHKEISELLNISDNTSKSQLNRARLLLQKKITARLKVRLSVPFEKMTLVKRELNASLLQAQENLKQAV